MQVFAIYNLKFLNLAIMCKLILSWLRPMECSRAVNRDQWRRLTTYDGGDFMGDNTPDSMERQAK